MRLPLLTALCGFTSAAFAATPDDGSVLPFPLTPSRPCAAAAVAKPPISTP